MKTTHYVLKVKDCFGDLWPVSLPDGCDGVRHASFESAKQAADRFKADKEFRVSCREISGWQKGTLKGLEIQEIFGS